MGFAVGMRAGTGPGAGAGRRPASGVPPFERQSPGRRVRPGGLEGEQTCTGLSPRGLHSILRFRRGVSPLPHVTWCPQAYSVSGSTPCLFCHSGGGAVTGQPGVGEGNLGSEEGPFLEPSDLFCLSTRYAYGSTRSDQAPLARRLSGARGGHRLRFHYVTQFPSFARFAMSPPSGAFRAPAPGVSSRGLPPRLLPPLSLRVRDLL